MFSVFLFYFCLSNVCTLYSIAIFLIFIIREAAFSKEEMNTVTNFKKWLTQEIQGENSMKRGNEF